jgi:hypothetical protein
VDIVDEPEDLIKEIQDFHLMRLSISLRETFWTRRRSSKIGVIMQQLGNQSLLNNLFMVEIGMMGMGKALIHYDNELSHNIVQCIEIVNDVNESRKLKRKRVELWDVKDHWKMVKEVQAFTNGDMNTRSSKLDNNWEDAKNMEIWEIHMAMFVLEGNQFSKECGDAKKARVSKHILHYY